MRFHGTHHPTDWRTWYQLEVWRRRRRLQLRFEPLCALCYAKKPRKITPATIADHVKSHRGDWNEFRLGKLQSLCAHCHDSLKKIVDHRGYDPTIGPDGMPTDKRHPVYGTESATRSPADVKPVSSA